MALFNKSNPEKEMSFLDHLEELRWHLVRGILSVLVFSIVAFIFKHIIFDVILFAPSRPDFITFRLICKLSPTLCQTPPADLRIYQRVMGEEFMTHLKVAFWFGLTIGFPYLFYELWRFVSPGLHIHERKAARGIVFYCSALFLLGVLFGYFVMAPFAISFLLNYSISDMVAGDEVTLASYMNYMVLFTLPTGLVFLLPVLIYILAKIDLITPEFLRQYRKHAFVVLLVVAALITPSGDPFTQLIVGLPLYGLYEIGVIIAARVQRKNKASEIST